MDLSLYTIHQLEGMANYLTDKKVKFYSTTKQNPFSRVCLHKSN